MNIALGGSLVFLFLFFKWLHKLGLFQLQGNQLGLNKKENDSLTELTHFQGYRFQVL